MKRVLSRQTVTRFGLGYAPEGWSNLIDAMTAQGYSKEELLEVGLVVRSQKGGLYDRFRNRVMFPIMDANSRVKPDTVLGVVMSGMFGLGVVLYTQFPSDVHLDHILVGNILGLTPDDFRSAGTISALVGLVLLARQRDFALAAFDPVQARIVGLPVGWLHYGLLAMISLRLLPMVPFWVLNYAAAVAKVRLFPYFVGTVVGVLPGTIAVVVLGDAVMSGEFNPTLFAVSVAGAAVGMAGSAIAARRVPGPPPVADAD